MVERAINVGNRPLQGTKLFVMVAISRSLGESIILQAITPAALQPKPIHMVRACFRGRGLLKIVQVKGYLGKYPKSSSTVKRGKNMAIGGSITDTTQATVLYMPNTKAPWSQSGIPKLNTSRSAGLLHKTGPLPEAPMDNLLPKW